MDDSEYRQRGLAQPTPQPKIQKTQSQTKQGNYCFSEEGENQTRQERTQ